MTNLVRDYGSFKEVANLSLSTENFKIWNDVDIIKDLYAEGFISW